MPSWHNTSLWSRPNTTQQSYFSIVHTVHVKYVSRLHLHVHYVTWKGFHSKQPFLLSHKACHLCSSIRASCATAEAQSPQGRNWQVNHSKGRRGAPLITGTKPLKRGGGNQTWDCANGGIGSLTVAHTCVVTVIFHSLSHSHTHAHTCTHIHTHKKIHECSGIYYSSHYNNHIFSTLLHLNQTRVPLK